MKNDDENLDMILKDIFENKSADIIPSQFMLQRIKAKVKSNRREPINMKFLNPKKLVVIGVLCLASVSCYAAIKLGGSVSHSQVEFYSINDIEKYEQKVGFSPKYVEAFDNGFKFKDGSTGDTQGVDNEFNPTGKKYKTMNLTYENEEGKWVAITIDSGNPWVDSGEEFVEGYSNQVYKFVPPNYILTEEDKIAEENGSLVISYGSDSVQINNMESYMWIDDGLYYSMVAQDCDLGEEEMAKMVKQMMDM